MIRFYLTFALLLTSFGLTAQSVNQDFGIWSKAKISYKLGDFRPFFNLSHRTDNNSEDLESFIVQVGTSYKLNKHFKFSLGLRSTYEPNLDGNGVQSYRYILDAKYYQKIKKFNFSFRNRFQTTYQFLEQANPVNRFMIKIERKIIKKLTGFVANEWFLRLVDTQGVHFDRYRIYSGLEYRVNKRLDIAVKYIRINRLALSDRFNMNIISASGSYLLKFKKKKKAESKLQL
jgi:hypothetical protein